jgi:hypothetical protein
MCWLTLKTPAISSSLKVRQRMSLDNTFPPMPRESPFLTKAVCPALLSTQFSTNDETIRFLENRWYHNGIAFHEPSPNHPAHQASQKIPVHICQYAMLSCENLALTSQSPCQAARPFSALEIMLELVVQIQMWIRPVLHLQLWRITNWPSRFQRPLC